MCRPLAITLLLAVTLSQSLGQTHVQTTTLYQVSASNTINLTFGAVSTTHNLIVVHVDWDNQARGIASISDSKGNTYRLINGPTNWNGASYRAILYYAYNIAGGGAPITVTVKLSGAPTSFIQMYLSEYSGVAYTINPLDQNSVATGNAAGPATAISSGAKTTTWGNELIYGISIGAAGLLTTGAGFTTRSAANQNIVEDKTVLTAGSYSANFTSAGGNWIAQMGTFITENAVLPVDLSSFTQQCTNNHVVLDWTTASESNNAYFTIEGSANGSNWTPIGTVKGAGTSSVALNYSYTVPAINDTLFYFRLKQTDLDGRSVYSNVIGAGDCSIATSGVKIFPNPSDGKSLSGNIEGQAGEACQLEIFDNAGKVLHHGTINRGAFRVGFPQTLPAGVYYARFFSAGSSTVTPFVVKH
jgi:hypothetical protein